MAGGSSRRKFNCSSIFGEKMHRSSSAISTRGVRAYIRGVAGCATPTGSAGYAVATANLKLTFDLDHSAGAYRRDGRRM